MNIQTFQKKEFFFGILEQFSSGPLLQHAYHPVLYTLRDLLSEAEWQEVTMIVGIEARGFILAAGLEQFSFEWLHFLGQIWAIKSKKFLVRWTTSTSKYFTLSDPNFLLVNVTTQRKIALAAVVNKGFLPIRKLGKLPGITQKQSYHLEYGEACLEMHPGRETIVIVDDVLATGGTLNAAQLLAVKSGYQVKAGLILLNLKSLNTQKQELEIRSVLEIE